MPLIWVWALYVLVLLIFTAEREMQVILNKLCALHFVQSMNTIE